MALASTNPVYRGIVLLAALATVAATTAAGRSLRPLLVGLLLAALGAVVLSGAVSHLGGTVVLTLPGWLPVFGGPITLESLAYGGAQALGLVATVLAFAPWSLALESHEMVDALPAHLERTGALLASALNMAPRIARSFTGIAESQRMRGWRPRGPASWAEVLVPALLTAMEDSIQVAEAMEARAFGSGPRSRYAVPVWNAADVAVLAASVLAVTAFLGGRLAGAVVDWHPYPLLLAPALEPAAALACVPLVLPALVWRRPSSRS